MSEEIADRLAKLALVLPEAEAAESGWGRPVFRVRKKVFAYYGEDPQAAGRVAVWLKVAPGEQEALIAEDPERFYSPPYTGPRGWVGVWLDLAEVDWDEVRELLVESYRLIAPKRLVAQLDEEGSR